MTLTEHSKQEFRVERTRLIEFLNTLDLLASKYHLAGEFEKERRIKTIEDFIIELLVTIPEVNTLSDAIKLYQGQQLAVFLMQDHEQPHTHI